VWFVFLFWHDFSFFFLFDIFAFFDGALLRCSTQLPTFTGSMLCSFFVVAWTVFPLVLFFFSSFLLSPSTFLTVLLYDDRLNSGRSGSASYRLRTFLPFFAFDVILCFASFLTCIFPDMDAGGPAGMFLPSADRFSTVVFHNVVSFVFSSVFWFFYFLYSSPDATTLKTLSTAGIFCASFFMDPGSTAHFFFLRYSISHLVDMALLVQFLWVFIIV
jgi:hypothetical protein